MSVVEKSSKNDCLSNYLEIQLRRVSGLCYLNVATIAVEYIVKRKFQNKVHILNILHVPDQCNFKQQVVLFFTIALQQFTKA